MRAWPTCCAVVLVAIGVSCGSPSEPGGAIQERTSAVTSCSSHTVQVVDLQSDFRDIWAGRETTATGKQADPAVQVTLDFNTTVQPSLVSGQFVPAVTDGSCGGTVATKAGLSVIAPDTWGKTSSDSTRPAVPAPYNVFARETVSGVVSAAGPVAAGGDISLTSFSVNGTALQPVGMIAGGKVTVSNGSINGNVTYGVASTIPQTVTVSGTKTLQAFSVDSAFQSLEVLSALLASQAATGTAVITNGTLQLTGSKSGLNVFALSADTLAQAFTVNVNVPVGAGALINVTGASIAIQNKSINVTGVAAAGLLWNLPSASFVQISSVGLIGSVLAPDARLTFDSGSINGSIVVRSFSSSGSGSLQHAPLNVGLLLGSASPSAIQLVAATPLVRGCTYQFVIPSIQALTSGAGCLAADLRVSFRVAGHASTAASRELANATSDPALKTLRRFESRSGINTPVADIWSRYENAIGVSHLTLVPTGSPRPNPSRAGQMLTTYQQYLQSYPVAGFGYVVATENGIFRSADGRTARNLPSSLPAPVSAAAALQAALQFLKITNPPWVANPAKYHAPLTTLALVPQNASPANATDFRLIWHVRLIGTGVVEPGGVEVDAGTGIVLDTYPAAERQSMTPTFLDPRATYVQQVTNTVDTLYGYGARSINVAQYRDTSGVLGPTLSSGPQLAPGTLNTQFQAVTIGSGPPPPPLAVTDPTPATPWTTTEPTERAMASAQWGLQRANAYLSTLALAGPGANKAPWTSIDGKGHQNVLIRWQNASAAATEAGYAPSLSDADTATVVATSGTLGAPVGLLVIPHEFGHAFTANLRLAAGLMPDLVNRYQSGSIGEALADLFAIASTHAQLGEIPNWDCISFGACFRNVANPPDLSQPDFYLDPNFQVYTPLTACDKSNDNCAVHSNSTVLSHWGYLLAVGSAAVVDPNPCGLTVQPLDANRDAAFTRVLTVGYNGIVRVGFPIPVDEPTFAEFRDATLRASQDFASAGSVPPDTTRKIELAYYAVGLGPEFLSAPPDATTSDARDTPQDDGSSVYPWLTFSWPTNGDGQHATAWDFQIADGPFDTNLKLEKSNITDTITRNGVTLASFTVALPFESMSRFFWRVRPHATGSWLGCYPVHSFKGTGSPGAVKNITPSDNVPEDGILHGGDISFVWDGVDGATSYNVFLATRDANCTAASDVFQTKGNLTAQLSGLQPQSHYFVNVQPIGPNGFDGKPSVGGCFKTEFDTVAMRAPVLVGPADMEGFDFHDVISPAHPTWSWRGIDGPDHYILQFYEMDEFGQCALTPAKPSPIVSSPCPHSQCDVSFGDDIFPAGSRNATGYCWSVTSVAQNGNPSPASQGRRFVFVDEHVRADGHFERQLAPGEQVGLLIGHPHPLPKDAYGKPVTFTWEGDADAFKYVLKVGRWPWNQAAPVDPPTCTDGGGGGPQPHQNAYPCATGPAITSFRQEVQGTSVIVDGSAAAQGRYCWVVWPEIFDSGAPGKAAPRQPYVSLTPFFCYTSPPATPIIMIDNPPKPNTFSSAPITGHINFAYVPDGQFKIDVSPPADFQLSNSKCPLEPNAADFSDYYDCEIDFTITPHPAQHYSIVAHTWSSDQQPPVMDATSAEPDVPSSFDTPPCGAEGQACCDTTCNKKLTTTQPGLACVGGTCTACGGLMEQCCPGSQCVNVAFRFPGDTSGTGVSCQGATCSACGAAGQVCCPLSQNLGACPGTTVSTPNATSQGPCVNNHCVSCGHSGEPCCSVGSTSFCGGSLTCNQGTCGSGGGGGGGTTCAPGTASCGSSGCIDPNAVPEGEGWQKWRADNPTLPAVDCRSGLWDCSTTLSSFPTPPGLTSQIAGGTAVCCPPTAVGVAGGLCIEEINNTTTMDDPLDQP